MKYSLGISNFLEIFTLSYSIVFLYSFALITEEGFLISPCYSLECCIQLALSSLSHLPLASFHFSAIWKASSDNHFAFLCFFLGDSLDHHLLCNVMKLDPHFFRNLFIKLNPLNPSLQLYNHKEFDLGYN